MWLYTFHACAEHEILYELCFFDVIWYVAGHYVEWDSL
jgi:hypothetical protein